VGDTTRHGCHCVLQALGKFSNSFLLQAYQDQCEFLGGFQMLSPIRYASSLHSQLPGDYYSVQTQRRL